MSSYIEIRTPDCGKIYIDRQGLAWSVDSRRLPQYDTVPAGREPDAAAVALELARLWRKADAEWQAGIQQGRSLAAGQARDRRELVAECARACGDKVHALFLVAIRPENQP